MAGETIKEFLVSLGFNVNESDFKKFTGAVGAATIPVLKLGAAVTSTALAVEIMVERIARQFEELYYASQRTNSTVSSIQAVGFASKQIGLSVSEGVGQLERFAHALRMNPPLVGMLSQQGIKFTKDAQGNITNLADAYDQLLIKLREGDRFQALQFGSQVLNLDPDTLNQELTNLPQRLGAKVTALQTQKDFGFDPDKAAADFTKFAQSVNVLENNLSVLGERIAHDWLPVAEKVVDYASKTVDWFGKWNTQNYSGLTGMIVGLGVAIGGLAASLKVLSAVPGLSFLGRIIPGVLGALGTPLRILRAGPLAAGAAFLETLYGGGLNEGEDEMLEKYNSTHSTSSPDTPLGIRTHNPGNLQGANGQIIYGSDQEGLSAMARDLMIKYRRGLHTTRKIVTAYLGKDAPLHAGDYISDIQGKAGFSGDQELSENDLTRLQHAMVMHENKNQDPYSAEMYDKAFKGAQGVTIVQNNKTDIIVSGAGNPGAVGRSVADEQSRVSGDAVRNLSGAIR